MELPQRLRRASEAAANLEGSFTNSVAGSITRSVAFISRVASCAILKKNDGFRIPDGKTSPGTVLITNP
jgi:hypothetical protein